MPIGLPKPSLNSSAGQGVLVLPSRKGISDSYYLLCRWGYCQSQQWWQWSLPWSKRFLRIYRFFCNCKHGLHHWVSCLEGRVEVSWPDRDAHGTLLRGTELFIFSIKGSGVSIYIVVSSSLPCPCLPPRHRPQFFTSSSSCLLLTHCGPQRQLSMRIRVVFQ